MIKISTEQLEQGLEIAQQASCPNSFHCLWGKHENIPKRCGSASEIVRFRKMFESDSPAFFAKFLELSEYQRIIHTFNALETEGGSLDQVRDAQTELHDLHIFAQVSLLTLYPLFLANKREIPFLLPKEIEQEERSFSKEKFKQIVKKMSDINSDWFGWIVGIMENLYQPEKYSKAIALLVGLFLKGVEKSQLPCPSEMSEKEKENFFAEIETFLSLKKK